MKKINKLATVLVAGALTVTGLTSISLSQAHAATTKSACPSEEIEVQAMERALKNQTKAAESKLAEYKHDKAEAEKEIKRIEKLIEDGKATDDDKAQLVQYKADLKRAIDNITAQEKVIKDIKDSKLYKETLVKLEKAKAALNKCLEGHKKVTVPTTYPGKEPTMTPTSTPTTPKDGKDGKDGKPGEPGKPGRDGKDGLPGKDGKNGKDGICTEEQCTVKCVYECEHHEGYKVIHKGEYQRLDRVVHSGEYRGEHLSTWKGEHSVAYHKLHTYTPVYSVSNGRLPKTGGNTMLSTLGIAGVLGAIALAVRKLGRKN